MGRIKYSALLRYQRQPHSQHDAVLIVNSSVITKQGTAPNIDLFQTADIMQFQTDQNLGKIR